MILPGNYYRTKTSEYIGIVSDDIYVHEVDLRTGSVRVRHEGQDGYIGLWYADRYDRFLDNWGQVDNPTG